MRRANHCATKASARARTCDGYIGCSEGRFGSTTPSKNILLWSRQIPQTAQSLYPALSASRAIDVCHAKNGKPSAPVQAFGGGPSLSWQLPSAFSSTKNKQVPGNNHFGARFQHRGERRSKPKSKVAPRTRPEHLNNKATPVY